MPILTIVKLQSTNVKLRANFKIWRPEAMRWISENHEKTNDYRGRPNSWLARQVMAFTELFRR
jgi:hypothetical protein